MVEEPPIREYLWAEVHELAPSCLLQLASHRQLEAACASLAMNIIRETN